MPKDILRPFINANKNRNEIFFINYHTFMYNRTAALSTFLLLNHDKYIGIYPKLNMLYDISPCKLYEITSLIEPLDLLKQLYDTDLDLNNNHDATIVMETLNDFNKFDIRKYMVYTMFAYSLSQICKEKCCSKFYMYSFTKFTKYDEAFIISVFGDHADKVELIEGKSEVECWLKFGDEITTSFINSVDSIVDIANTSLEMGDLSLNDKLFLVKFDNRILTYNEEIDLHTYTEDFINTVNELKSHNVHVGTIQQTRFETIDNGEPIYKVSQ